MENLTITPMYAGMLGIILLVLSIRVVAVVRAKGNVGYGDGGNPDFTPVVRGQANFIEYVPLIVILIGMAEAGGTLRASLQYSTDLFDAETVQRMLGHYEQLLASIAAHPERDVAAHAMLTADEREHRIGEVHGARG